MARERILVAQSDALLEAAQPLIGALDDAPDVVAIKDGPRCVVACAKLLHAQKPPLLVVLDDDMARIDGPASARALRAMERAFDAAPTAILFYASQAADPNRKALLAELGRAVHLQRKDADPIDAQARRLAKATAKLLAQVRGR